MPTSCFLCSKQLLSNIVFSIGFLTNTIDSTGFAHFDRFFRQQAELNTEIHERRWTTTSQTSFPCIIFEYLLMDSTEIGIISPNFDRFHAPWKTTRLNSKEDVNADQIWHEASPVNFRSSARSCTAIRSVPTEHLTLNCVKKRYRNRDTNNEVLWFVPLPKLGTS